MKEVAIIGVGIHEFGRFEGVSALDMATKAILDAIKDASVDWKSIQALYGGSMMSGEPDGVMARLGLTGAPVTNIKNGCATGGACLRMAAQDIVAGAHDIVLAFGFDKCPRGMFNLDMLGQFPEWVGKMGLMVSPPLFAMNIREHMEKYGTTEDHLVKVAVKSHKNGSLNPNAMWQQEYSYEEIANSRMVADPLRLFMITSPNEGAAAAVLCRADIARRYTDKPIMLAAVSQKTRLYGYMGLPRVSYSATIEPPTPTNETAKEAYEISVIGPDDLDVVELQDTEAGAEILHMEEIGLCKPGEAGRLIDEGATEINGRIPVNPSGGIMCSGEPVGASGMRQVHEIVLQLRGQARPRQVSNAKIGMTHVFGAPGISAVTILKN